eukprot:GHVT01055154.1.p1 GENE.GHVT01055154.1~~GHVT01055154.1.p1  ORF type:complete len:113 (-),score=5.44 GHVT01055154.1:245-583(-)
MDRIVQVNSLAFKRQTNASRFETCPGHSSAIELLPINILYPASGFPIISRNANPISRPPQPLADSLEAEILAILFSFRFPNLHQIGAKSFYAPLFLSHSPHLPSFVGFPIRG